MVYGDDPRKGYFEGHHQPFYSLSPFSASVPKRLEDAETPPKRRSPSAPRRGMGSMYFSPPAGAVLEQVVLNKAFLSQQGVKRGQGSNPACLPPVCGLSYFAAQTLSRVRSRVWSRSFPTGGPRYEIMAYSGAGNLGTYDDASGGRSAASAELSDPSALNGQPARVEVVSRDQDMTVAQFNQSPASRSPRSRSSAWRARTNAQAEDCTSGWLGGSAGGKQ